MIITMKKYFLNELLILIFICFSLCHVNAYALCNGWNNSICTKYGSITISDYIIINNIWNANNFPDGYTYQQCICYNANKLKLSEIGWEWDFPKISDTDNMVKTYPKIMYGYRYWNNATTTEMLPLKLSKLSNISIVSAFSVNFNFSGSANLAYDIWITDDHEPNENDRVYEIMIWLDHKEMNTGGSKIDDFLEDFSFGHVLR